MTPRAVLLDLDGVLYVGDEAIPGAVDTLATLTDRGLPWLLVTNTTSRPRSAIVDKLAGFGIEVGIDSILTPTVAAGDWLRRHGGAAATFFAEATAEDLGDVERLPEDAESGAGAVIVGDLGEGWDFATLNRAFRLLMAEERPPLLALGMTRFWEAEDGLRLDTAPFVRALEHAAEVDAQVLGKPAKGFFEAALDKLGVAPAEALMIGDDVRSDIGGAQAIGVYGVLVRTGKFRPEDLESGTMPYSVIDSVADLPALLDRMR